MAWRGTWQDLEGERARSQDGQSATHLVYKESESRRGGELSIADERVESGGSVLLESQSPLLRRGRGCREEFFEELSATFAEGEANSELFCSNTIWARAWSRESGHNRQTDSKQASNHFRSDQVACWEEIDKSEPEQQMLSSINRSINKQFIESKETVHKAILTTNCFLSSFLALLLLSQPGHTENPTNKYDRCSDVWIFFDVAQNIVCCFLKL
jgi:hypothetical protein